MQTRRRWGALLGVVAVGAGLAASEVVSGLLHQRVSPVVAVAEGVIQITPGRLIEFAISTVGNYDKPLLVGGTLFALFAAAAVIGVLATRTVLAAEACLVALGVVAAVSVNNRLPGSLAAYVPVIVGTLVSVVMLSVLANLAPREEPAALAGRSMTDSAAGRVTAGTTSDPATAEPLPQAGWPEPRPDPTRRRFLAVTGGVALVAVAMSLWGRALHQSRAAVEAARRNLALGIRRPATPPGTELGIDGVVPWITDQNDFYLIHTAISPPQVLPEDWELRIHGMVDHELTLTYQDLVGRGLTEAWVTLCCVSNQVGGDLISNARWAGVRIADVLAEVGLHAGADAVKTTSADGWTCGTPLGALTDDRNAMFAVAMNGEPLSIEHGFPVRMVVPGLYGFVSATKWVVDFEVTRFADFEAFWTQNGWSEQAQVKTQSRIDVPGNGSHHDAGEVTIGGIAWAQHRGITGVEVSIDDGPWETAELGADPTIDTWRQWGYVWPAEAGEHRIAVRATDTTGEPQTEETADVVPDGATGHHTITVHID